MPLPHSYVRHTRPDVQRWTDYFCGPDAIDGDGASTARVVGTGAVTATGVTVAGAVATGGEVPCTADTAL